MHVFNSAGAARPRHKVLRALTSCALLSSPWIIASAAPVLSGTPTTTITAARYYAFQPGASASGKKLTFAIVNKPSWAQFDVNSGRLYGTPLPQTNVGVYSNIVISASDGTARASLAPFSITVLALPNIPPIVKGSPAGVASVGSAYTFQATASDPNGLKIVFGIWNQPSWTTFNSATGLLSGTPTASNAGTYSNIVITAYDGYTKAVLPAFSITVKGGAVTTAPPPTASVPLPASPTMGSATLSWTPPTQRTNGAVLTDLAGYHIYYGKTPSLGESVTLANPGLTRYVMTGLTSSTWYFEMTAYDTGGNESFPTGVQSVVME